MNRLKKKICIVTGSRAEYGLLKHLARLIDESETFELQLLVTGMHLSPEFGLTYKEIESDGFQIHKKIEMLLSSDSSSSIAKSMGLGMIGFADAFSDLQPDLVILLGDRTEILSVASVCLVMKVPIAHLHGGETTEGAYDEAIRHSVTKMSSLHFVAAEEYRMRVVQLGEDPSSVFTVGGLGVDAIHHVKLISKEDLEAQLDFEFGEKNLLVTFHPVTMEENSANDFQNLLSALDHFPEIHIIFTLPNSDVGGRAIIKLIQTYCENRRNSIYFSSLGQQRYYSLLSIVDGVVGNSSSGLLEVPSFKKGTINIGNRQKGRLKAESVIDCEPAMVDIKRSIECLYSNEFQNILSNVKNAYGDGDAAKQIFEIIKRILNEISVKKNFFDISFK
ncbi:UDP-N-acetylglucosamine 2-epimerase [Leptospira levettii]|uniref:UDP-N-acetylglucosamine 2-epimerase n=1 Tax=Leptospira levettii TaxID=2023178 RepID=UPI00223D59EE|nr:UDP-N-acetylglucosamine 2-epimerase [Leptospira levettii]MCW7497016.1 UDP-N-acetylglucosamine 2-epimerase [Leptospira levettii]